MNTVRNPSRAPRRRRHIYLPQHAEGALDTLRRLLPATSTSTIVADGLMALADRIGQRESSDANSASESQCQEVA